MRVIIFLISFLIVVPAFSQKPKKKEDETTVAVFTGGIVYSLPRTGIAVNLKTTCTAYYAGPFAQYAEQLLGITHVKTANTSSWSIEDMKIEIFSEPDPESIFRSKGEVASRISLSPAGCLAGINSQNQVQGGLKLVDNYSLKPKMNLEAAEFNNLTSTPWFTQGDSSNTFRITRIPADKKAAEAAAKILECRRIRYEMAAGLLDELPPDGKAYEECLKELEGTERENLKLFIGTSVRKQSAAGFSYIPPSKPVKGDVLFRFSEERGILPASDLSGKPVTIDIQPALSQEAKDLAKSDDPDAGSGGVFYRIPVIADFKIFHDLQVISSGRITIPQMGLVVPLAEELLDGSYSVEFNPETGAVKNIRKNE